METINEDEEEKILSPEEAALLALRQVYKKKKNLIRAEAHREFAKECTKIKVILKWDWV